MDLKEIESVMQLMKTYKVNKVTVDGFEITKTLHDMEIVKQEGEIGLPTTFEDIQGVTPWPKF